MIVREVCNRSNLAKPLTLSIPTEKPRNFNLIDLLSCCIPTSALVFACLNAVFLNRRAAARYRALASIIPGGERPEETTICYKISLVQLINNLNVILYLSTCYTVYISVLIIFMIMP